MVAVAPISLYEKMLQDCWFHLEEGKFSDVTFIDKLLNEIKTDKFKFIKNAKIEFKIFDLIKLIGFNERVKEFCDGVVVITHD